MDSTNGERENVVIRWGIGCRAGRGGLVWRCEREEAVQVHDKKELIIKIKIK